MTDQERWDERHRAEIGREPRAPDDFVLESLARLGDGAGRCALDLASGGGRHALALAERGYTTSAWDVSGVALELVRERAAARGLSVETRRFDLALEPRPSQRFDLIVLVDYLDRTLLSELALWLAPAGHAIVTTFTADWPDPHPSARFRLRRGELGQGLAGLITVRARERGGRAGLLARRGGEPANT